MPRTTRTRSSTGTSRYSTSSTSSSDSVNNSENIEPIDEGSNKNISNNGIRNQRTGQPNNVKTQTLTQNKRKRSNEDYDEEESNNQSDKRELHMKRDKNDDESDVIDMTEEAAREANDGVDDTPNRAHYNAHTSDHGVHRTFTSSPLPSDNGACHECHVQPSPSPSPSPSPDVEEMSTNYDVSDDSIARSAASKEGNGAHDEQSNDSGDRTTANAEEQSNKSEANDDGEGMPVDENSAAFKSKYARLNTLLDQTALYSTFLAAKMPTRYSFKNKDKDQHLQPSQQNQSPTKARKKRKTRSSDEKESSTTGKSVESISQHYDSRSKHSSQSVHALQGLVPRGLELRDYQMEGVDWLISLYENGLNGILADEMGLGKTIQIILFLCHLWQHHIYGPHLIVAPLSTLHGWESELKKWAPEMEVCVYHGDRETRTRLWSEVPKNMYNNKAFPVIITSFEIALHDRRILNKVRWKQLIVDEGHRLKNINSKLLQELKLFMTEGRLLLTGTPLQNNLRELWSLLNFVLPTVFDDLKRFESWFTFDEDINTAEGQMSIIKSEKEHQLVTKLHTILRPFVLRRLKNEVLLDLPSKREFLIYCPMSPLQERYYAAVLDHSMHQIVSKRGISLNNMLMQLRKICNHPYLLFEPDVDDTYVTDQNAALDHKLQFALERAHDVEDDSDYENMDNDCKRGTGKHGKGNKSAVEEDTDVYEFDINAEDDDVKSKHKADSKYAKKATTARTKGIEASKSKKASPAKIRRTKQHENERTAIAAPEQLLYDSGKLWLLDKLLSALEAGGHKTLIFSQMTRMLDILEDWLSVRNYTRGVNYCRIDGMTKSDDRNSQMQLFNSSKKSTVFLLSTRAGGLGINLTAADSVVIYDSDWNPTRDMQAMDRCHRIGQDKPVHVYRLLTPGSVEVNLLDKAILKRKLERVVMARGRFRRPDDDQKTSSNKAEDIVAELIHIFNYKSLPDTLHSMHHMNGSNTSSSKNAHHMKDTLLKGSNTDVEAKAARQSNVSMVLSEREATKLLSQDIIDMIVDRSTDEKQIRAVDAEHTDALMHGNATLKEMTNDIQFMSILDVNQDPETHGKNIFG